MKYSKYLFAILMVALLVGCTKQEAPPAMEQAPVTPEPKIEVPAQTPPLTPEVSAEKPAMTTPPTEEPKMEEEPKQDAVEAGTEVQVEKTGFNPAELKVKVGTMVTFKNMASSKVALNSMTKGMGDFRKSLGAGESYQYTFSKAGSYVLYDAIHKHRGAVTVEE